MKWFINPLCKRRQILCSCKEQDLHRITLNIVTQTLDHRHDLHGFHCERFLHFDLFLIQPVRALSCCLLPQTTRSFFSSSNVAPIYPGYFPPLCCSQARPTLKICCLLPENILKRPSSIFSYYSFLLHNWLPVLCHQQRLAILSIQCSQQAVISLSRLFPPLTLCCL